MNPFGYSERVWTLFSETPGAGELSGPDVLTGVAGSPAGQNRLQLQVRMAGPKIAEARFQAYGCPTTIAVGAWLAQRAPGLGLLEFTSTRVRDMRQALDIPEDRLHCVVMAEDALKSLAESREVA